MPDFIQFLWWIYIFSYFVILDCISGFIAIWFRTIAQFETGLSFHFLYNSVTRKYNNLNNEFSFGKEPRFVTLDLCQVFRHIFLRIYMFFQASLEQLI